MQHIYFIALSLILVGCLACSDAQNKAESRSNDQISSINKNTSASNDTSPLENGNDQDKPEYGFEIGDSIGLLTLESDYNKPNDLIKILNEDGSIWHEFTFYYDDSDGHYEYMKEDFRPFAFHPDYFNLGLRVVKKHRLQYEIIVNERTGLKKFADIASSPLAFQSWEDHVLGTFAVEFDKSLNPVLVKPDGEKRSDDYSKIITFHPEKIDGDWLFIKWEKEQGNNSSSKVYESGWIRWRIDDRILINWFYMA